MARVYQVVQYSLAIISQHWLVVYAPSFSIPAENCTRIFVNKRLFREIIPSERQNCRCQRHIYACRVI